MSWCGVAPDNPLVNKSRFSSLYAWGTRLNQLGILEPTSRITLSHGLLSTCQALCVARCRILFGSIAMLRQASSTPCPVSTYPAQQHRDSLLSALGDDSTANIEFTAAFPRVGAGLRNAKPRRRPAPKALDFAIHEDDEPRAGDAGELMKAVRRNGGASVIAQPPQRPKRIANSAASASAASAGANAAGDAGKSSLEPWNKSSVSRRLSQAPRRPVVKADAAPVLAEH